MAAAAYSTECPWSQDPWTGVCRDGVRYCGASLGSTFLLENGASVDGAPVVLLVVIRGVVSIILPDTCFTFGGRCCVGFLFFGFPGSLCRFNGMFRTLPSLKELN